MHWIYLIQEFHNLSWITEINELFHDIIIYWDAPVLSGPAISMCVSVCVCVCMRVCVCVHVYVVYEDTNLYNDMGMT